MPMTLFSHVQLNMMDLQIRILDTRIHHKFKDNFLLRECGYRESDYAEVAKVYVFIVLQPLDGVWTK